MPRNHLNDLSVPFKKSEYHHLLLHVHGLHISKTFYESGVKFFKYCRVWNGCSLLNKRSPPPKSHNFNSFLHQSRHCGHFSIFFSFNFSKIDKPTPIYSGL